MQKPADIKELVEIITARVKTHMTANGIIYDHIYHTNDLSHYEGMKYDPDCEYIVFEYSISDDDKNVSAFACNNTYEQFNNAVINTDEELKRLPSADYDLCCALITMLLREDHFHLLPCFPA